MRIGTRTAVRAAWLIVVYLIIMEATMAIEKKNDRKAKNGFAAVRGAVIACAISIGLVAAAAFVFQKQWLGMDSIPYVNTAIKAISAVIAALIAAKQAKEKTLLQSALASLFYILMTFIVFSLITAKLSINVSLACDIAMCVLAGCIVGIIHNLKR